MAAAVAMPTAVPAIKAEPAQAAPWFYAVGDIFQDPSVGAKLVVVPPSSSVEPEEAAAIAATFRNVAVWLPAERRFLVATGERLGFTAAMAFFKNTSKRWSRVHPVGGSGDPAGWQKVAGAWPPSAVEVRSWGFLVSPDSGSDAVKATGKRKLTDEDLADSAEGPHGTRVLERVRPSGKRYRVYVDPASKKRFSTRKKLEEAAAAVLAEREAAALLAPLPQTP